MIWCYSGQGDFDGGGDGDVVVEGGKTPHGSVYPHCEIPSHALNIKFKSSHCLVPSDVPYPCPVSYLTEISRILNTSVNVVS